jgi:malate dehydrogenase
VLLEGEYGQSDICVGVPVIIGENGWEQVIEFNLSDDEKAKFEASAQAVRNMNAALDANL